MTRSHFKAAGQLLGRRVPQATGRMPFLCGSRVPQLRVNQKSSTFWNHSRTFLTVVSTPAAFNEAKVAARIEPSASKEVAKAPVVAVMQFSADWCGPCRMVKPAIEALSAEHPDVQFYYVDIEALEEPTENFDIKVLPTFLFFSNGKLVDRCEGAQSAAVKKKLESTLDRLKNGSVEV